MIPTLWVHYVSSNNALHLSQEKIRHYFTVGTVNMSDFQTQWGCEF